MAEPVRQQGALFAALDATLGVEGLPQSGTGQATLFSGVNCAALAGRHWGPFPHSTSRPILHEHNLFTRIQRIGRSGQFLNAYPDRFFRAAEQRGRWTVTTRCCIEASVPLKTEADLRAGRALAADLTAIGWREQLGLDVETLTPREAGARLADLNRQRDLTLFEYFLTDKAGHARDGALAARLLRELDACIGAVIDALDPSRELLVVTSDHGNIEDLSTRSHTLYPVPLAAYGAGAEALGTARSLTDVTPALVALLDPAHAG